MTLPLVEMLKRIDSSISLEDRYKLWMNAPRWKYLSNVRLNELTIKNPKASEKMVEYIKSYILDHETLEKLYGTTLYMGLDQFLIAKKDGEEDKEFYYWRKHYELEIWMYKLFVEKHRSDVLRADFNNVYVPIEENDISALEFEILFGDFSKTDPRRFETSEFHEVLTDRQTYDLEAIKSARQYLKDGWEIFYVGDW